MRPARIAYECICSSRISSNVITASLVIEDSILLVNETPQCKGCGESYGEETSPWCTAHGVRGKCRKGMSWSVPCRAATMRSTPRDGFLRTRRSPESRCSHNQESPSTIGAEWPWSSRFGLGRCTSSDRAPFSGQGTERTYPHTSDCVKKTPRKANQAREPIHDTCRKSNQ